MDFQKFLQGKAFDAYEYFGAHLTEEGSRVPCVCTECSQCGSAGRFFRLGAAADETETESWCF